VMPGGLEDEMSRGFWAVLVAILCISCSDSVIGPEEALIGSWRTSQGASTVTWTFLANGSLRVVTETDEIGASLFTTQYRLDGQRVTIFAFNGNDDLGAPVDFPASSCTVEINDRSLRMTCDIGVVSFTRVGPGSEANAV
jgi:hypothetical protein